MSTLRAGLPREPVTIGPYRPVQRVGEGGMGIVHLALDPQGRTVALKVLRDHVCADPEARIRLRREVESLRRVRSPHVAEVLAADLDGDRPYLATRFIPGPTGSLSPEGAGGWPVTPATDWWGWGATLAFAASGRSPFGGGPVEVVLDRVRQGRPDLTGIDPRLARVLDAALAPDPTRRPAGPALVAML